MTSKLVSEAETIWQNFVRTRFGLPRHIYGVTNFMNFKVKQITLNSKDSSEHSQWKIVHFSSEKNYLIPCNVRVTSKLCCVSVESAGPGPEKNETSDLLVKKLHEEASEWENKSNSKKEWKSFVIWKNFG